MAAEGGLDPNKRLTNHIPRLNLVPKLRDSGITPTDIMQIIGHKYVLRIILPCPKKNKKQQMLSHFD